MRQMLRLAGPYWNSAQKWKIRGATLLLLLLTVGQVGLSVWGNYWNRDLFDALEERSVRGVVLQVAVFALIFAISIGVTAAHLLVKRWLQLDWRAWLTEQLIGRWMENGRHHRLLFSAGEHDNPDQRIAEDIRIATESAIALGHTLVLLPAEPWLVHRHPLGSVGLDERAGHHDPGAWLHGAARIPLRGPGHLASAGCLDARWCARPTPCRPRRRTSALVSPGRGSTPRRLRSCTASLMERSGAAARFAQIVRDWDRQSLAYMGIVSFTTGYGGLLPVFPILVAAPQYILGAMSLGVLMQAAQAFQRLTSALSWPVDNVGEIARCRTSAGRVLSLYEDMQQLDAETRAPDGHRISARAHPARPRLEIEDLCIADPAGHVLLEHFSAEIQRGERVLVAGDPAVTGSLFKVIAGLWPWGSGRVLLPEDDGGIMFMPQRPFLPEGTLARGAVLPAPAATPSATTAIRYALECAGIAWLAPRLDEPDHWEQALPLRAQQRLGFARVLMQRPAWIFMEEATDAFDPKGERLILEMLHRQLPDTAVLTISFHPGLEAPSPPQDRAEPAQRDQLTAWRGGASPRYIRAQVCAFRRVGGEVPALPEKSGRAPRAFVVPVLELDPIQRGEQHRAVDSVLAMNKHREGLGIPDDVEERIDGGLGRHLLRGQVYVCHPAGLQQPALGRGLVGNIAQVDHGPDAVVGYVLQETVRRQPC